MSQKAARADVREEMIAAADAIAYYRGVYVGIEPKGNVFNDKEASSLISAICMHHEKIKALNSFGPVADKDSISSVVPVPVNRFSLQQKLNMVSAMGEIIDVSNSARFSHWQDRGLVVALDASQDFSQVVCLPHGRNNLKCAVSGRELGIDSKNGKIIPVGKDAPTPTSCEATRKPGTTYRTGPHLLHPSA